MRGNVHGSDLFQTRATPAREREKDEGPAAWKSQATPRGGYIRLRAARDLRCSALSLKRDVCSFRNGATREKRGRPGRPQVEEKCEEASRSAPQGARSKSMARRRKRSE